MPLLTQVNGDGVRPGVMALRRWGNAWLRHAEQTGAQLLVAAGYVHSRLRQWALRGVARDLLPSANLPVSFPH